MIAHESQIVKSRYILSINHRSAICWCSVDMSYGNCAVLRRPTDELHNKAAASGPTDRTEPHCAAPVAASPAWPGRTSRRMSPCAGRRKGSRLAPGWTAAMAIPLLKLVTAIVPLVLVLLDHLGGQFRLVRARFRYGRYG